ncbi:valine--tRNA ligase [Roseibium aggregatum]|uniref:Valine--tRNA ligase n=1 Tax=Roseibium aggregatum TaxID=187304 RepID=A0A926P6Q0_9HYPH|nr:valine--tRNA ligase [Roseibium aggregatum]MBD1549302.1 valine--tRNA ligase [Roseibium aggregatum]
MLDKTYDAAGVEPRIYETWEKAGAFKAGAGAKDGAPSYTIVIPPPNVTGSLHMGHALNNTLQDILVRFERMRGKDVLWQPGMDHAGIATQMVVERQLAERQEPGRREMGREAFVERVWSWKEESGGMIFNQLKRLGASCDWSRERFTMDEGLSEAVLKVFVELYREGLIYRGKRLVNWDPKFETAISDLEVENKEVDGHMWHFKYPLADGETYEYVEKDEDGNVTLRETRDYISIATTRPETMLGDGAVAVHPSDERYKPIVGKLCEIPVGPKEHRRRIPIIVDEYPDPDFGSGAVKITGAHDFNDYQVARRNNIPLYRLMDTTASMRDDGPAYADCAGQARAIVESGTLPDPAEVDAINLVPDEYRGLDRYVARERIVAAINADGLAVTVKDEDGNEVPFVENKKIMQPFGDRSHVVIEPMLTDQWFADAKTLAKPAIASVREDRTRFVPKNWEKTYFDWMENIEPWCISRQLWWGHQIPAWYGPDGEVFVAHDETEAAALAEAHYGKSVELTRDEDVLDTWFSSALWPFSTLGWPDKTPELDKYFPTSVLITGFDIIFFWVARMMMFSLHFMKEEPFKDVYIHALVRDEKGQKMSKSKGNVIDPLALIEEFGADALRFTLAAMAAQGRDIKLATSRVAGYRNFATKLWNAARFAEMNGCARVEGFDPASAKLTLNRWIATEVGRCISEVTDALVGYRFNEAAGTVYRFVWNTYCDWFLELAKPVFNGEDEAAKAETRATAAWALDEILKVLHPFMPFLTEELWERLGETGVKADGLLMQASWPTAALEDEAAAGEINWLVGLISEIRSVRAEMNVPAGAKVPVVIVGAGEETKARITAHEAAILRLARAESIELADTAPAGAAQIIVGEATVCLPLAGIIDLDAERGRLGKEADKLGGEISRIEKKLSNPKFVEKAPEEVVEGEREKMAEFAERLEKVQVALKRLAEIG